MDPEVKRMLVWKHKSKKRRMASLRTFLNPPTIALAKIPGYWEEWEEEMKIKSFAEERAGDMVEKLRKMCKEYEELETRRGA
jgi:hypothetical protein